MQTLSHVLDLDREDIERVEGMTPERTDQLLAFLTELTTEEGNEDSGAAG